MVGDPGIRVIHEHVRRNGAQSRLPRRSIPARVTNHEIGSEKAGRRDDTTNIVDDGLAGINVTKLAQSADQVGEDAIAFAARLDTALLLAARQIDIERV